MTIEQTKLPAAPANLIEALANVQAEIPDVEKDRIGRVRSDKANYSYRYADLSAVTAAILPLLGRNGLAWTTQPTMTDHGFVLLYTLMHSSGESLTGEYPLPDPQRTPPQQVGSALTYARRYCLCAVTGVAPGDDDDDAAAFQQAQQEPPRPNRSSSLRRRSSQAGPLVPPDLPSTAPPADQPGPAAQPAGSGGSQPGEPDDNAEEAHRRMIRRVMAMFTGAGFTHSETDRARRLRVCSTLVGHPVASATDLTEAEGQRIIAAFGEHRADVPRWLARLLGETEAGIDSADDEAVEDPIDDDDRAVDPNPEPGGDEHDA